MIRVSGRRVLVTGASGFIGSHLCGRLEAAGFEVVALTRASGGPDLLEPVDWSARLEGVTHVVHLAGLAHATAAIPEATYRRVNAEATRELAEACARVGARMVFLSSVRAQSGAVADRVLTEDDEPRPTDAYGRSKLEGEAAVRALGERGVVLRPVLVYGPGVKGNMAALARLARSRFALPLGALDNRRSLVAVENLCAAVEHALLAERAAGGTFLVADPEPMSVAGLVTAMRAALGRPPGLVALPKGLLAAPLRALGRGAAVERLMGELVVDASRLVATGWRPAVATRAAITAMMRA